MNAQITAGISKALRDPQTAAQYAHNPVAYWQSIGGTLPPGVSAAQFAARVGSTSLHKEIVERSTGHGQMSVMDRCATCMAGVQFALDACGVAAGVFVPGVAEWIAAMAAANPVAVSAILGGGGAVMAGAICKSSGQC